MTPFPGKHTTHAAFSLDTLTLYWPPFASCAPRLRGKHFQSLVRTSTVSLTTDLILYTSWVNKLWAATYSKGNQVLNNYWNAFNEQPTRTPITLEVTDSSLVKANDIGVFNRRRGGGNKFICYVWESKLPQIRALLYFSKYASHQQEKCIFCNHCGLAVNAETLNTKPHIVFDCLKCTNPRNKQFSSLATGYTDPLLYITDKMLSCIYLR